MIFFKDLIVKTSDYSKRVFMKKISSILTLSCLLNFSHAADQDSTLPWFTGPLLTPSPNVVPAGHFDLEPYFYYSDTNGIYDSEGVHHDAISLIQWYEVPFMQFGIAKNLEFDVATTLYTNKYQGDTSTAFGDTTLSLSYQAYQDPANKLPNIKVGLKVLIPTGKFDSLDATNPTVGSTGSGYFATTFSIGIGQCYHIIGEQYLNLRTYFGYTYPFCTHVEGFNVFGGGFETSGEVYPGKNFSWLFGAEYSLTKNWVLAFDVQYSYTGKTKFSGIVGRIGPAQNGVFPELASIGSKAGYQWSIAPAIEYNWNDKWGIILGPWFTIAGENTEAFIQTILALNISY